MIVKNNSKRGKVPLKKMKISVTKVEISVTKVKRLYKKANKSATKMLYFTFPIQS